MAGDEVGDAPADAEETPAAEAPESAEGAAERSASDEGASESEAALLFLDPRLEESEAQALEGALGRPVRVCSEDDVNEAVAEAQALVVPFELPTRSGLEWVEAIRLRERSCDPPRPPLPIIVVSKAPTRARVLLALRAGASSFAFQPYDADELRVRLESVAASGATASACGEAEAGS
ncbi:MAG: hypothetical protein QNK04_05790 [Myxococcota bacterium]|nr:hypothetical protein [Myxococcota bacterium]